MCQFNGWTIYYMKGVHNMPIKKYIGARYAPKFMGAWDKTNEYAALSVVYANEQSYVSRKTVPANTEITNTEFWIKSADWNAQVTQYNQNVERYEKEVLGYAETVNDLVGKTVYTYNTKDDMAADKRVQLNDTLMTCGYDEVNDKKGSFYKAVATTSAKAIALQNKLFAEPFKLDDFIQNYVTPEDFGAAGDGITDDTDAINKALEHSNVLNMNAKTYLVSANSETTIAITAHNKVINGNGATIKIKPVTGEYYKIINITGSATISNLTIIGERDEHIGTSGEWGHGINISKCDHAHIENVTVKNCWGDGIYLGSDNTETHDTGCNNVTITNCLIDNNRRNGISVIDCDNFVIDGCTISNANGANPQSGIDIERNSDKQITKGTIKNSTFIDNHFNHILQSNSSNTNTIENCTFKCLNNNASSDIDCESEKLSVINCLSNPSKRATLTCNKGVIDCFNHITVDSNTDSNSGYDAFIYSDKGGTVNVHNCFASSHNEQWRGIYLNAGVVNIYNSTIPQSRYHEKTIVISECNPIVIYADLDVNAYSFPGDIIAINNTSTINIRLNLTGLSQNTFTLHNKGSVPVTIAGDISDTIAGFTTVTFYWDGNALHKMN
nr:MAG TPA: tailspike protein [Caudoviricetes sp.]